MQDSEERIISALFFSSLPYRRKFSHFIKENYKKIKISGHPWKENEKIIRLFYGKKTIEMAKRKTMHYLEKKKKGFHKTVFIHDSEYPELLREIYDPPAVLFLKFSKPPEKFSFQDYDFLAMVGTRKPVAISLMAVDAIIELYHHRKDATFLKDLVKTSQDFHLFAPTKPHLSGVKSKIATVSGFARGIDARVHHASLHFRIPTFAVLGAGIDRISPKQNLYLYEEAIKNDTEFVFVSEFFPTFGAGKHTFPLRNRIIVGLSLHLIIVQAGITSGAMISAGYALQENRDIYCFDHPYFEGTKQNAGSRSLLQEGAYLLNLPGL